MRTCSTSPDFHATPRYGVLVGAALALIFAPSTAYAQDSPERIPQVTLVDYEQMPETSRAPAPPGPGVPTPASGPIPTGEPEIVPPPPPVGGGPEPIADDGFVLAEAEWIALRFNPALRQQAAAWGSAQGRAVQAGLYPNPVIGNTNPIELAGSSSLYSIGFAQEIVVAGKKRLDRAAVEQEVRQAEWGYLRTRFDVLYDVRTQFYITLVAQERFERLSRVAGLMVKSTEISQQLEKAGEGSRLDVLQLQIEAERSHAAAQNVAQVLIGQRRTLAAKMGIPVEHLPPVVGDLNASLPNFDESAALHYVMTNHAATQIAQLDVRRNRVLLDRAIVEPIPNIDLQAGYQYNVGDTVHNHPLIAFYAEVPLWDRNQGAIRSQREEVARAAANVSVTQNSLASQLAAALSQYRAASLVTQRYVQHILPASIEAQSAIQRGYTQGEFDLLRVLQSQRTLLDAELGYLDAQEQRWTSAATVSSLLQQEKFP